MPALRINSHNFKKIKEFRLSRNIISYLIFVTIASILWLLNALNKDYSVELTYPIKYTNFPEGKFPVIKLPEELHLSVNANGFALLGYRMKNSFLPITFNISAYTNLLQQDADISEYTFNTNSIKDKIGGQINSNIKLLKVYPEEIIFKFAVAKRKRVSVRPTLDYTLKRQYILTEVTTTPATVSVSGPATVIDTLQYIATAPLHLKELSKNVNRKLAVLPPPDCTLDAESVDVFMHVEQFTEAKRTLPIKATGVPENMSIRLFPPYVTVSYEIGLSQYDKVSNKDFVFSIDYPTDSHTNFLEVKAVQVPDFIENLTFTPQKVEYILEKN